jgi:hypothetical protein
MPVEVTAPRDPMGAEMTRIMRTQEEFENVANRVAKGLELWLHAETRLDKTAGK